MTWSVSASGERSAVEQAMQEQRASKGQAAANDAERAQVESCCDHVIATLGGVADGVQVSVSASGHMDEAGVGFESLSLQAARPQR
jgi:hypothetical protein